MCASSTAASDRREASSSSGMSRATYSRSQEIGTFISELAREAQVVFPQLPEIWQAVAQHGDPLQAEPEREAGHLLRVVADRLEHVRVDVAGPAHLDPARPSADRAARTVAEEARDIQLGRGLGEGEVARPQADLPLLAE